MISIRIIFQYSMESDFVPKLIVIFLDRYETFLFFKRAFKIAYVFKKNNSKVKLLLDLFDVSDEWPTIFRNLIYYPKLSKIVPWPGDIWRRMVPYFFKLFIIGQALICQILLPLQTSKTIFDRFFSTFFHPTGF